MSLMLCVVVFVQLIPLFLLTTGSNFVFFYINYFDPLQHIRVRIIVNYISVRLDT